MPTCTPARAALVVSDAGAEVEEGEWVVLEAPEEVASLINVQLGLCSTHRNPVPSRLLPRCMNPNFPALTDQ